MIPDLLWLFLCVQISLGAFDTLYHHELTQRLAWKPRQQTELALHGARNLIYAIAFLMLGLSEPQGAWAVLLIVLLGVEALITLWDFVEEDRSRLLPASERVTHTLLTLNYGVILAMLLPLLAGRAGMADSLPLVWQGWMSVLFAIAAAGVVVSGLRDVAAARRMRWLAPADAAPLAAALGRRRNILITGGTGLVGTRLVEALAAAGHQATVLTRDAAHARHLPAPIRIVTDVAQIGDEERFDAIVNLAGASVATRLWTRARRAEIVASRERVATELHALCRRLIIRPPVILSASAVGYYGDAGEAVVDENSPIGEGFAAASCAAVEKAADRFAMFGMRAVKLRIGLVLAYQGGLLGSLLFPFEAGMGGPIGHGRQYMSWIHRDDLVRLIAFAIAYDEVHGPLNATAPNPVRSRDFARALGRALGRWALLPLPAFLLKQLPGGMGRDLFLASQRVLPVKAVFLGFRFRHPHVEEALADILGKGEVAAPLHAPTQPFAETRMLR